MVKTTPISIMSGGHIYVHQQGFSRKIDATMFVRVLKSRRTSRMKVLTRIKKYPNMKKKYRVYARTTGK